LLIEEGKWGGFMRPKIKEEGVLKSASGDGARTTGALTSCACSLRSLPRVMRMEKKKGRRPKRYTGWAGPRPREREEEGWADSDLAAGEKRK
jgi:hypothetical protein